MIDTLLMTSKSIVESVGKPRRKGGNSLIDDVTIALLQRGYDPSEEEEEEERGRARRTLE